VSVLNDILPQDRSDAAPITQHLRGLLQELRREGAEAPRITITLDADAWSALELQFRRPFRPHSSYKYLPLDAGVVAFERRREEQEAVAAPQTAPLLRWWENGPSHTGAPAPRAEIPPWTPERVEAQAASISAGQRVDERRPEDAIYSAPMVHPMTEISGKVDVATYAGPWKEPK
jgi:hypothetical protein